MARPKRRSSTERSRYMEKIAASLPYQLIRGFAMKRAQ